MSQKATIRVFNVLLEIGERSLHHKFVTGVSTIPMGKILCKAEQFG